MSAVLTPMHRDFRRLAKLAREILRQCRHYEMNQARGEDDELRALIVAIDADNIAKMGARMHRRWRRARALQEAQP